MIHIADRIQDAKSKLVYGLIRSHGTVSKQDLIQWSGLAPSTMVRILDDLLVEGLIREAGYGESTGGRRPFLYETNPKYAYVLGLEISKGFLPIKC
ncbi:hypothetical protein [Paenibacillus cremeus]|uniref:MarR family transcriptional regulator n=1 Tax=Paenibacillus cremeus TaxID=2163881 RepID=A0A559K3X5_9BACL|nr:hypothetical protein [Paenibacillus cremeus]TVY06831.1 hypothetical protein FPZ49_26900 [Paenibacillus cremeus]